MSCQKWTIGVTLGKVKQKLHKMHSTSKSWSRSPGYLLVIVVENVVLPKFFRNFLDREDGICETSKVCSLKLKL